MSRWLRSIAPLMAVALSSFGCGSNAGTGDEDGDGGIGSSSRDDRDSEGDPSFGTSNGLAARPPDAAPGIDSMPGTTSAAPGIGNSGCIPDDPTIKPITIELKQDPRFGALNFLTSQVKVTADKLGLDDLGFAPPRQSIWKVIPSPNIISFFGSLPIYKDEPRSEWGLPTTRPLMLSMDIWAPVISASLGQLTLEGDPNDPLGYGKAIDAGYFGPVTIKSIEGDPEGLSCAARSMEVKSIGNDNNLLYRVSTKGGRFIKKGWDLKWKWMPYCIYGLPGDSQQFGYAEGTIDGRPVETVGFSERTYSWPVVVEAFSPRVLFLFGARGEDGKFEYGEIGWWFDMKPDANGEAPLGFGFYHKEGEAPVLTSHVKLIDVKWGQNPQHPEVVVPIEATIGLEDKELYFKAVQGANMMALEKANLMSLAGPAFRLLHYSDTLTQWREKNSPKFNLSVAYMESVWATPESVGLK